MKYLRPVFRILCLLAGIVFLLRGCGSKAVFYAVQWDFIPRTMELPIVSTDQIRVAGDGRVFVALPYCGRIQIYDVQGNFQDAWTFKSYGGKFSISLGEDDVRVITPAPHFFMINDYIIYTLSPEGEVLGAQREKPWIYTIFPPTEDEFAYDEFHVRVEQSQIHIHNTETDHITKIALHEYRCFFAGGWPDILTGTAFILWFVMLKRLWPVPGSVDITTSIRLPEFGKKVLYLGLINFLIVMLYVVAFALFNQRVGIHKQSLFISGYITGTHEIIILLSGLCVLILMPISIFIKPRFSNFTCALSSLVLLAYATYYFYPFHFGPARESSCRHLCIQTFQNRCKDIESYAHNHQGKLPDSDIWCDDFSVCGLIEKEQYYRCPMVNDRAMDEGVSWEKHQITIAMNANVSGKILDDLPANIVLFYESGPGWNLHGGPELLAPQNHFYTGCNVIFGDLHADFVPTKELGKLRWQ